MIYNVWNFLALLGSLSLFIYGMKVMSEGVQKVTGNSLRNLLNMVTEKPAFGVFSGVLVTSIIQSSSAITVVVVSFVNAGFLSLTQAISVIMGANIGTTITGWIVAIIGLKTDLYIVVLPLLGIGVPVLLSGVRKWKPLGEFLIGLGLLFLGLSFLKDNVPNLENHPEVLEFVSSFSSYGFLSVLLFILIGTILTVIVQSSSAAMGITIIMVFKGWITFDLAAAMILGENIGTTSTAILASLIGNRQSKRAALAHFTFNLIGVVWMAFILTYFLRSIDYFGTFINPNGYSVYSTVASERYAAAPIALALFHTAFNCLNTLLLVWFIPTIEKLLVKILPDKEGKEDNSEFILGKNLVDTPELAVLEVKNTINRLGDRSEAMFMLLKQMYVDPTIVQEEQVEQIKHIREGSRQLAFSISKFLKEISQTNITEETSKRMSAMLSMVNNLEKIGNACLNTSRTVSLLHQSDQELPEGLKEGLADLFVLVEKAFEIMNKNLKSKASSYNIDEFDLIEAKINGLRDSLRIKHLEGIEKKSGFIQTGLVYREIYSAVEKIADYIYNVNEFVAGVK